MQTTTSLNEFRVPAVDVDAPAATNEFDPFKAALRFVDGAPTTDDIAWVGRGFAACLVDMGAIPLERCLRLPTTPNGWRELRRDQWLCKAASLIDAQRAWVGAESLHTEWTRFIGSLWLLWRDDESPPSHATALSEALFYATRLNRSETLGTKQIRRIVGHVFASKCR
ncbi:MAG: hypothetical protein ACXW24_16095 [Telluria sp.]